MEKSKYKRVFITGALGFIGRALAARYRELGVEVRGVDLQAAPEANVVAGDIAEPEKWSHQMEGCDLVIHTAAIVSNNVDLAVAWHANVVGTQKVLEAAINARARRFVFFSSAGVVRFANVFPAEAERFNPGRELDERWPLMPIGNPYVDTKTAAEHLVLAAHASGEMACTIVRPADVYGPGSRPWVMEPLKLIRKGTFLLSAHGKGLHTPIYMDDLVDGVCIAAEKDEGLGQIFLIGGEKAVTTVDYFSYFYRMLGKPGKPPCFSTPVAIAIAEAVRLLIILTGKHTELGKGVMLMFAKSRAYSNAKTRRLLKWEPKVDLDEGMRRTEAWLRSQGIL